MVAEVLPAEPVSNTAATFPLLSVLLAAALPGLSAAMPA